MPPFNYRGEFALLLENCEGIEGEYIQSLYMWGHEHTSHIREAYQEIVSLKAQGSDTVCRLDPETVFSNIQARSQGKTDTYLERVKEWGRDHAELCIWGPENAVQILATIQEINKHPEETNVLSYMYAIAHRATSSMFRDLHLIKNDSEAATQSYETLENFLGEVFEIFRKKGTVQAAGYIHVMALHHPELHELALRNIFQMEYGERRYRQHVRSLIHSDTPSLAMAMSLYQEVKDQIPEASKSSIKKVIETIVSEMANGQKRRSHYTSPQITTISDRELVTALSRVLSCRDDFSPVAAQNAVRAIAVDVVQTAPVLWDLTTGEGTDARRQFIDVFGQAVQSGYLAGNAGHVHFLLSERGDAHSIAARGSSDKVNKAVQSLEEALANEIKTFVDLNQPVFSA